MGIDLLARKVETLSIAQIPYLWLKYLSDVVSETRHMFTAVKTLQHMRLWIEVRPPLELNATTSLTPVHKNVHKDFKLHRMQMKCSKRLMYKHKVV